MIFPHPSKAVIGALIAIWAHLPVAAGEALIDQPNVRRLERPILFPAACLQAAAAEGGEVAVDVEYEIGRDWQAKKIRVRDSSDSCFDEAATASVRTDLFLRREKKKSASPAGAYHHRIIFTPVHPSRPPAGVQAERVPPIYPQRCFQGAARLEIVVSAFDINESGATENIRTVDSRNSCLDDAATQSIQKWRYVGAPEVAATITRRNILTETTFELFDESWKQNYRVAFKTRSGAIRRSLRAVADPQSLLTEIAALEDELGPAFSRDEARTFHQLRAAARLASGDRLRALDDLRFAMRAGNPPQIDTDAAALIEKLTLLAPGLEQASAAAGPVSRATAAPSGQ